MNANPVKWGWLLVLVALTLFSLLGLNNNAYQSLFTLECSHLWANVAWLITAIIFVLMMTPGLSFFIWRNG